MSGFLQIGSREALTTELVHIFFPRRSYCRVSSKIYQNTTLIECFLNRAHKFFPTRKHEDLTEEVSQGGNEGGVPARRIPRWLTGGKQAWNQPFFMPLTLGNGTGCKDLES